MNTLNKNLKIQHKFNIVNYSFNNKATTNVNIPPTTVTILLKQLFWVLNVRDILKKI